MKRLVKAMLVGVGVGIAAGMLFIIVEFAILIIRINALMPSASWGIALSGPSRLTIFVTARCS